MKAGRLRGWGAAFGVYRNPKVVAMLFLGFSAGVPLLLVFGTLSAWLRTEGVERAAIGFISWVTLAYGLKFAWAPLVDRLRLPFAGRALGQRRSWMLLAQGGIIFGLLAMAAQDPLASLTHLVLFAVATAFASATQDIAIDAWRIEIIDDDYQGAMAGAYQLGYRLGMILAGGGAFTIAEFYSWPAAYACMAGCMLIGVATVLLIDEPPRRQDAPAPGHGAALGKGAGQQAPAFPYAGRRLLQGLRQLRAWFADAVAGPFIEFFTRYGAFAVVVLGFIMVFRLSDITLGVMAIPFYIDMQYRALEIGLVTKTVGPVVTIAGALLGGVLVARYGAMRMLLAGTLLVIATNLLFAWLATQTPLRIELGGIAVPVWLALVVGADNIAAGIAATTFVAYLSGLTHRAYTATQYALFSSIMLILAKFIAGFSGVVVDAADYVVFFIYAAALGLPSVALIIVLARYERIHSPRHQ